MRNRRAIIAGDVLRVFDTAVILRLAKLAQLPDDADLNLFGERVRVAARIYARDAAVPSNNELRRELVALHRLAARLDYECLANAIENMTPAARHVLYRPETTNRVRSLHIPQPAELKNPDTREQAAAELKALIQVGGHPVEGRKRPNGHRSQSWAPLLQAPGASRSEPRREAERALVMWLQIDVLDAGGPVPTTAHHDKPGPFVRFLAEVLHLVGGAGRANAKGLAVELINSLRRRKYDRKAKPPAS